MLLPWEQLCDYTSAEGMTAEQQRLTYSVFVPFIKDGEVE